jgi:hypothetical protein
MRTLLCFLFLFGLYLNGPITDPFRHRYSPRNAVFVEHFELPELFELPEKEEEWKLG